MFQLQSAYSMGTLDGNDGILRSTEAATSKNNVAGLVVPSGPIIQMRHCFYSNLQIVAGFVRGKDQGGGFRSMMRVRLLAVWTADL
jgi:hypothetical protein